MLNEIKSPADIKGMSISQLEALAVELRKEIVSVVSEHGGHLSSNLGSVELTLAIHYVFDCPEDKLVFDVGHQAYAHKLLTGRYEGFKKLRSEGGVSGFPRMSESEYDAFTSGHASTAISAALGMARTRDIMHGKNNVLAVVGDGALSGGMCYEALNDAGQSGTKMIVILNDNKMSISGNVGAMSQYLTRMRQSHSYRSFKFFVRRMLEAIPMIGAKTFKFFENLRDFVKSFFVDGKFFDALGFMYIGPIDGHDLKSMINTLKRAKDAHVPVLLHMVTQKGKGYLPAENHPDEYHGVAPFRVESGKVKSSSGISAGKVACAELVSAAESDIRVCVITAAMPIGTGMTEFQEKYPERFFDVGIAEEHAVTMAAGMAASGMKPYFAVYSTFLQRAYDQLMLDVCMNSLPVTLLIDRAGMVGADGRTHQGLYDISYLRMLPNIVIAAPRDVRELKRLVALSLQLDAPMAIRYPRDVEDMGKNMQPRPDFDIGEWELLTDGADVMFLAVGRMVQSAMQASIELMGKGIHAGIIDARFIKPMDEKLLTRAANSSKLLVTLEENVLEGGFGEGVMGYLSDKGIDTPILCLGVKNRLVEHMCVERQLELAGLDPISVTRSVLERIERERARA